jgi:cyclopropane fatty-acyl-phospholipid synthase-like methyltransferase
MSEFKSTHDGSKTISIDGTGQLPSVDQEVAKRICNFIKKNIVEEGRIIDFGAGVGHFQKFCEDNEQFDVWSIEGYSNINFVADRKKWLVKDLGTPLEKQFKNKFDLVVSFECIEHVHETQQEQFWENVFLCANKALVSIHTENEEHDEHCFIRKPHWWQKHFEKKGYNFTILGTPSSPWDVWERADCSMTVLLEKRHGEE